jgi:hypothetical protein
MAKRGRKRKGYFYEEQEKAFVDYLNAPTQEDKEKIYNKWLKPAFNKMVESIINRYKLYPPDENFQETFNDTISFMISKIDHFDPSKGYKAYSYCGTVCKNYLIYKMNQFSKNQKRSASYENIQPNLIDNIKYSSNNGSVDINFITELMKKTTDKIQKIVDKKEEINLSRNEIRVGEALIELMTNWEEMFSETGSNKFNKSSILLFLKESTLLTTPEIRDSMKKYKAAYYDIKKDLLEYL